jgi:hypothetical protein
MPTNQGSFPMQSFTDLDLAQAYNDIDVYPKLDDVARRFSVSIKTVKNRIGIMRRESNIELISRNLIGGRDADTVLSEKPSLYMAHWTAADCISRLRELILLDPNRGMSRKRFSQVSGISESTWNRFFGTFQEFERQADVKLSRGAHQMERNIARHASRDHTAILTAEKRSFIGKYVKKSGGRFKTVVVGSDFHDHDCDMFVRRIFVDTIKRLQPDCVFLNGDMLDLPEFGRYPIDPRTWDVVGRIRWLHELLRDIRESSPDSHIVYLEGNHEFRLLRHLTEATPALKTVLGDLHGFTVSKLLGLDEFEVEYCGKADLKAWTNQDSLRELHKNQYLLWEQLLGDHFPTGIKQGIPGWNGHHHKFEVRPLYTRQFGASQWVQLAAGHVPQAEYCEGEKWNTGSRFSSLSKSATSPASVANTIIARKKSSGTKDRKLFPK